MVNEQISQKVEGLESNSKTVLNQARLDHVNDCFVMLACDVDLRRSWCCSVSVDRMRRIEISNRLTIVQADRQKQTSH